MILLSVLIRFILRSRSTSADQRTSDRIPSTAAQDSEPKDRLVDLPGVQTLADQLDRRPHWNRDDDLDRLGQDWPSDDHVGVKSTMFQSFTGPTDDEIPVDM